MLFKAIDFTMFKTNRQSTMRPLNCFKFYKLKVITYDISGQGSLPGRRMLLLLLLPYGTTSNLLLIILPGIITK